MDNILIEIHKVKAIVNKVHELEGIIRILAIGDTLKNNCLERIKEIKDLLKESKIKEGGK